jgi:YaaC-like Protein
MLVSRGADSNLIWNRIRMTRADPPGQANQGARRAAFSAALQQFEELMVAAAAVGLAARPLPLFYALGQAGRALLAAWGPNYEIRGHGLRLVGPSDTCAAAPC